MFKGLLSQDIIENLICKLPIMPAFKFKGNPAAIREALTFAGLKLAFEKFMCPDRIATSN